MAVVLNLPPQVERAYLDEARARGVSLDDLLLDVLLMRQPAASAPEMSAEEWVGAFREWIGGYSADNLPLLSDEAISREFIYRDRGL